MSVSYQSTAAYAGYLKAYSQSVSKLLYFRINHLNGVSFSEKLVDSRHANILLYDWLLNQVIEQANIEGSCSSHLRDAKNCIYFKVNNLFVSDISSVTLCGFTEPFSPGELINVTLLCRLIGGKGGFGALLRGQKGARRKVKNFDSCRDLSGRRLKVSQANEKLQALLEKKKKESDLVEALGSEDLYKRAEKEAEAIKFEESLQRLNKAYEIGLKDMAKKTAASVATVKEFKMSSKSDSTAVSRNVSSHSGRSSSLNSRILANLYQDNDSDDEDETQD